MYAHFYKTRTAYELIVSTDPAMQDIKQRIVCEGKRAARKAAELLNAKCWNF